MRGAGTRLGFLLFLGGILLRRPSLDRLSHIISLRHRHSLYSTIFTPPMGSVPLASLQKSILMTMVQLAIAQLYRPQFVQALTAQIREATIVLSFPFSILAASLRLILNSPQFLHVRLVREPCLLLTANVVKRLVSFCGNSDRFFMAYRS